MKKRSKSTWLTVYSGSNLPPFSPIRANGSSYTSISVLRFEVGCPFHRCLWLMPGQHLRPLDNTPLKLYAVVFNRLGGGPRVVVSTAAFHARVRGSVPGLGGLKETKLFLPHPRVKVSIVGSLRDREVACSASDRQGSNFEFCVWRTVSSQSSHHPQEVLLAQFSLYVHKGGLKPDSFHFHLIGFIWLSCCYCNECLNIKIFKFVVSN